MKILVLFLMITAFVSGERLPLQGENIEFVCLRTHKASNVCYFNFKVDGAKYTFVDVGCKKSKKKDDTIKKVKEGKLALSKDWKIECQ